MREGCHSAGGCRTRRIASPGALVKRVASSLTARCLVVAGCYAAFVAIAVIMVAGASDAHVSSSFVSETEFDAIEDEVLNDDYSALAESRFDDMEVLVLDEAGDALYSSSTRFSQAISKDDISFVNEVDWDARFVVFEEKIAGKIMYRVLWLGGHDDTGSFETIMGHALIDRDFNIVEGTIFGDRTSITPQQFGLLNGVIELPDAAAGALDEPDGAGYPFSTILRDGQYVISRTQGENDAGETRIVIKAIPVISGDDYNRVFVESQGIMLLLVPIIALATIVLFVIEARLIRSATRPLVRAISAYGETRRVEIDPERISSELVPIYDGFVELTRRLEHAQDDKQRMIADISHDIKTPLTVIRGYAQAFRDGMVPPDRAETYARALYGKAEIATSMVEALGEYAASEHPEYRLKRVSADLIEVLRTICSGLEPVVEQYGDTLEVELDDGPIMVEIDADLIRRALTNLVSNACTHNPAGTRVGVRCTEVRDMSGAAMARICVTDTGSGVPAEFAATLFDPFVTSNTARSMGGGTGLGLSIARRFIELNGGTLRLVEFAPAPWTTCFEITLPRTRGRSVLQ